MPTPVDPVRHLRQLLLADWGSEGQGRVAAAVAPVGHVPGGSAMAHEIATLYADRAGFSSVVPGPIDVERLAPSTIVSRLAARDVLAGSRAALAAMRAALAAPTRGDESASSGAAR